MQERSVSIYVVGPSSTGKTTLCNALARKLGLSEAAYVTEVARQVMKDKGYSRNTISSVQMQKDIMDAHYVRERLLDDLQCPIRLFDRSALDPIVYAILTSESEDEVNDRKTLLMKPEEFQVALARYKSKNSIVILLKPVPEWLKDDGVRSLENQEQCLDIFRSLLAELGIEYHEFGKEAKFLEERVNCTMGLARF
ncbi:hypothetical protein GALMADRAFT_1328419 [Galerina marginata CBS 339.88]|uniref:NadR/Ttd14 AAA domain-containing protein n=1 Tax=Galerina marginata (strain CBS 339.88) TaxID=685588 RepID=A0A067T0A7_GALM3|nr:hypothetical protein GALMADRAFT_1328419 [Galerina marginata CBS 339.88]